MKALGHSTYHGLGLIKAQPLSRPEVLLLLLFLLSCYCFHDVLCDKQVELQG